MQLYKVNDGQLQINNSSAKLDSKLKSSVAVIKTISDFITLAIFNNLVFK